MIKLIFFYLFYAIASAEIKFTNACQKEVIKLINNSEKNIKIAVYSINDLEIIESLLNAKERGVEIEILSDRLQAFGNGSRVKLLHQLGFNIKIHSVDRIMHHKFAIFDEKFAIEGSFNWTRSASTKNAEDCNVFEAPKDLEVLNKRFKSLWKRNSKEKSECYFNNMNLSKETRLKCN
jgi:cardiolipin hydrolase